MANKILSKSGDSLADVYDIEGSVAGLERLESEDVHVVHEMGGTIHSERLSGQIFALSPGPLAQTITWDIGISFSQTSRLLGVQMVSTLASRVNRAAVHVSSPAQFDNTDFPISAWNTGDVDSFVNILIAGVALTLEVLAPPTPPQVPSLLIGFDSPRQVATVRFKGLTTTFGAGTMTPTALLYIAFPQVAGLSSRGLPLPSW